MDLTIHGDLSAGPAIELDHTEFSYAGKFRMTATGKAVLADHESIIGAIAFSRDRTDHETVWFRYITVRADRRGEGIGPVLASRTAERLLNRVDRIRIAVNNPFAFHALYKAGFEYLEERTGLAELVLERPADQTTDRYQQGLTCFRDRSDNAPVERTFIEDHLTRRRPTRIDTS